MKRTYEELTHDVVMRDHWLEELRAENEKLAAALVAKDAALERCTKFTQEDYDALALQPCPEVLNKVRAEAVKEVAESLSRVKGNAWISVGAACAFILREAEHIEKGEA